MLLLPLLTLLPLLASAGPTPRAFIPPNASLVSIHPRVHKDQCLDVSGGVGNMHNVVM